MFIRKGCGKGFTYKNLFGKTVSKETRIWIESLIIPPAWKNVEISENPEEKILVTGRDEKNRKQYIYNKKFRDEQNLKKFDRIVNFAENLEHMRRVTGQHMRKRKLTREKVLATMLRLMDAAYFRPGSSRYTKDNKTYGLTTLRSKHLTIENDELIFSYTGKSHKEQERHVIDAKIAKIVKALDEMPGYEVFKYLDENDNIIDVTSNDLNAYIHEVMGDDFSAKDFRTWGGTMMAAIALDEFGAVEEKDQKELDKRIKGAIIKVSEKLGNTPSVAKSSYIDPRIIEAYTDGETMTYFKKEIEKMLKNCENLSGEELGVLCLLRARLKKS
ncbi:DNA topoisomerase IB [Halpernia frigidisoli]|uniref:DNA topoisomerase n=1 Tax=Halpernia frigidisoli TaxID=1125876 RepID=A0A1I3DFU4_9FLAO|nr:DNA topoisomerase IB [Halpernia frigidisoli]SFH85595.1 DNA topoisomerase-1 [Halpernia frigidisoli]